MRSCLLVALFFSWASVGCGSTSAAAQQAPEASADAVADSPAGDSPPTEAASGDSFSPDSSSGDVDAVPDVSSPGPSDDASGDSPDDATLADAAAGGPALDAGDFLSILPGIWLIGWAGNLNHYSWVRLGTGAAQGLAEYLSGADLPVNLPYWKCTGAGSWMLTQKPNTLSLTFPAACALPSLVLTFESFSSPTGMPRNATLLARVSNSALSQRLDGWKFAPSQCNQAMTRCTNPL